MSRRRCASDSPSLSRRDVLGLAAASALSPVLASSSESPKKKLIFILCTGGPSQLDTWDPKPDAPSHIRGPYSAIPTAVDGLRFSETLPRLARLAHHFTVIRSLTHDGQALHETGFQLIQTGHTFTAEAPCPSLAEGLGERVVVPQPMGFTGLELPNGQEGAAPVGRDRPVRHVGQGSAAENARYGNTAFGDSCFRARRLLESGTRAVTVNQSHTLFHQPTWDTHGYPDLPTRVADLKDQVAAPFDIAVSALIEDLVQRGLWDETVLCCFGEFGRTPTITSTGGRDHWSRCWSVMLGGGGIPGGQVIGASDKHGAEPAERPMTPLDLNRLVQHALR
jgi:uncharacterized protein (DUF1501 family)